MKAFFLHGRQDLRLAEVEVPKADAGQVVLRVRRAGICGSDIHYYSHGRVGSFVPKRPFVLGHEFAGEIVQIGDGVSTQLLGRRVTVDPSMPCGNCGYCRAGRYNLCGSMRFFGSASCDPHIDGGFEEYVSVPASNCLPLADTMSWGEAAMIEPLSVAVHAVQRAGSVSGRAVLVTGGGPIGQLVALVVRTFGASKVVLSDLAEFPRSLAVKQGADAAVDANDPHFTGIADEVSNGGFDFVFEAAGSAQALAQGLSVVRRGGTIIQVGTLPAEVTLPANVIMARELNLIGSFRFANVFPISLDLVGSRRIDLTPLISAVLPLDAMPEAMARAVGKQGVIKVQVES